MAKAAVSKWKKYRGRKRAVRKYKNRRATKQGNFRLVRRAPENSITNTSTLGIVASTGSVIAGGSPTYAGFPGYYHVPGSASFNLDDILNSSDIKNLFDQYRLAWIKIKVYCTSTTASTGSSAQLPSLIWSIDDDDNTFPTVAQMREKMEARQKMFYPGKPITIFIKSPRVQRQLDTAALLSSGNEVARAPWINTAYSTVPHYGLKFCILDANLNTTSTAYTNFKFDLTYCIHAKGAQ